MNYASIIKMDSSNGPGMRSTIFLSGCNIHCKGCFNKDAQDFNYGNKITDEVIEHWINYLKNNPIISGISVLGGEPFDQDCKELSNLLSKLSKLNLPIWIWSGHTFEELYANDNKRLILKNYVDTLIDKPYIDELHDNNLRFRGSTNQRIIQVNESVITGRVVLRSEYM